MARLFFLSIAFCVIYSVGCNTKILQERADDARQRGSKSEAARNGVSSSSTDDDGSDLGRVQHPSHSGTENNSSARPNSQSVGLTEIGLKLQTAVKRFDDAHAAFCRSSTTTALIENGQRLDRMVAEVNSVREIEEKASQLGAYEVTELRERMESNVQILAEQLYSDAAMIRARAAFESGMMYLQD